MTPRRVWHSSSVASRSGGRWRTPSRRAPPFPGRRPAATTSVRASRSSAVAKQIGHPLHAGPPCRLELVEDAPRSANGVAVRAHQLLAAATLLRDETGPFEHRHVLLYGGKADRIGVGEPRDRRLIAEAAHEDVAARAIRECMEQAVDVLFGRRTYNHLVVGYRNTLTEKGAARPFNWS